MLATVVHSQDLSIEQRELIQEAIDVGASQKSHEKFWSSLTPVQSAELKNKNSVIWTMLIESNKWQYAVWNSIFETVKTGKIVRTDDYNKYHESYRTDPIFAANLDKAEMLLDHAYRGLPIDIGQERAMRLGASGSKFILNEESAKFIKDNIGVTRDRLNVLLKPDWPPKQKVHEYLDQNLRFVSPVRLSFQEIDAGLDDVRYYQSQQRSSSKSSFEVVAVDWSQLDQESFFSTTSITNYEDAMGVSFTEFDTINWHRLPLQVYESQSILNGEKVFILLGMGDDLKAKIGYNFVFYSMESKMSVFVQMQDFLNRTSVLQP